MSGERRRSKSPPRRALEAVGSIFAPASSAVNEQPGAAATDADWARFIQTQLGKKREAVLEINERLCGPVDGWPSNITPLPLVLVLGNHSSGKSTFINYALGRQVQNTGVAVTDDGFTIIKPSETDDTMHGPAFLSAEHEGFSPLRRFGPDFANHFVLKLKRNLQLSELMFIDSPGMIDAKGATSAESGRERGYDFLGAVKWLAHQADVILFFFDPAKPGPAPPKNKRGPLEASLVGEAVHEAKRGQK